MGTKKSSLRASLPDYLQACDARMALGTAVLRVDCSLAGIRHIGSMWVKIYAAMTGTPIYDSRVAGAIATLVETWRREAGEAKFSLPAELTFPAVAGHERRTVRRRYPAGKDPSTLYYGAPGTRARWAGATVRLGG